MERLRIPELLKGSAKQGTAWSHAVIVTYSIDLLFFEGMLLREFPDICRNKILLADDYHIMKDFNNHASLHRSQMLHAVNQSYVAEAIASSRAAHAKMILLTNQESGRLLVGSGNLTRTGYVSGGEMFSRYEYSDESPEALPSFAAAWDFLQHLADIKLIGNAAIRQLEHLVADTKWLLDRSSKGRPQVVHNLETSFHDQLAVEVGGEEVDEMQVLSPFFDKGAVALKRTLETFRPTRLKILLQPEWTSVDPDALSEVLAGYSGEWELVPFTPLAEGAYVHAKCLLLKMKGRTICLQGSPNMSAPAMLSTIVDGNIEMANLIIDDEEHFGHMFDGLRKDAPTKDIAKLELSYRSSPDADDTGRAWILLSVGWDGKMLEVRFRGDPPASDDLRLLILDKEFPVAIMTRSDNTVGMTVDEEATEWLRGIAAVCFSWEEDSDQQQTNFVYVCNQQALTATLHEEVGKDLLDRAGPLNVEDEELERIVVQLDAALVMDRSSIWRAARDQVSASLDEDKQEYMKYEEIDFERWKAHPKLRAYRNVTGPYTGLTPTRLQLVLQSITDHFRRALTGESVSITTGETVLIDDLEFEPEPETETEKEQEEQVQEKKRRAYARSASRVWKNFLKRYLVGLSDSQFQDFVGYQVLTQNYMVFTHLLTRLLVKEIVEHEFVIESLISTWQHFWGDGSKPGYFQTLPDAERKQAMDWMLVEREDQPWSDVASHLLAGLYQCGEIVEKESFEISNEKRHQIKFMLRDILRTLLVNRNFNFDDRMFERTWHMVDTFDASITPNPLEIGKGIIALADLNTRYARLGSRHKDRFLRELETTFSLPTFSCNFGRVKIHRPAIDKKWPTRVLEISDQVTDRGIDKVCGIIQAWMGYENIEYYRIHGINAKHDTEWLAFYDTVDDSGIYWDKAHTKSEQDIQRIAPATFAWREGTGKLRRAAKTVSAMAGFPEQLVRLPV